MLAGDDEELLEFEPGEAAEELLARMLEARRYRGAAGHLEDRLAEQPQVRYRQAALPVNLRRRSLEDVDGAIWNPAALGRAIGGLLAMPAKLDLRHIGSTRVTVGERLAHLRGLLRKVSALDFDEAVRGADRMTVAMTVFALLELYKQGEASWTQDEPFSQITIRPGVTGLDAAG
jgi:segregation and condensation protein A